MLKIRSDLQRLRLGRNIMGQEVKFIPVDVNCFNFFCICDEGGNDCQSFLLASNMF